MDISVKYPHILETELLAGLPKAFSKALLDSCTEFTFDSPKYFLHQDEPAAGIFFVASGSVEIIHLSEEGQQTFLARAAVGHVLGGLEVVSGAACAATCEAQAGTILLLCPEKRVLSALSDVGFVRNLTKGFHERLRRANYFKIVDQHSPVDYRLCTYLLMFSSKKNEVQDSQTYLANVVGCSRQTINKELGMLRDNGFICINKGVIKICNRRNLEAKAESMYITL